MKNTILIIIGIFIALVVVEGIMRMSLGAPRLNYDKDMLAEYVDIYDDFFFKDKTKGIYVNKREKSSSGSFNINKGSKEKRVFIIGESVAQLFNTDILAGKLREVLPEYNWVVLNCGMGGYDSYRILLITKEIIKYSPDMIILMMGNNEGYHNPIKINYWIYKYRFLSKLWITRILTGYLNKARYTNKYEVNKVLLENLNAIVGCAEIKNIPIVLSTLPYNHATPYELQIQMFTDESFFSLWWAYLKHPKDFINSMKSPVHSKIDCLTYFLAAAYERSGDFESAKKAYRINENRSLIKRNDLIKKVAFDRKNAAILADIDKHFNELSGGNPGFDYFWDEMHYWPPIYELIADRIITSLYEYDLKNNGKLKGRFGEWQYNERKMPDLSLILENSRQLADQEKYYYAAVGGIFLNSPNWRSCSYAGISRGWYRLNRNLIIKFREFKEKTLAYVKEDKEIKWNQCLTVIGSILFEEGSYIEAMTYLNESIINDKNNIYGYFFRGLLFYNIKNEKAAENDFLILHKLTSQFDWLTIKYLDSLSDK